MSKLAFPNILVQMAKPNCHKIVAMDCQCEHIWILSRKFFCFWSSVKVSNSIFVLSTLVSFYIVSHGYCSQDEEKKKWNAAMNLHHPTRTCILGALVAVLPMYWMNKMFAYDGAILTLWVFAYWVPLLLCALLLALLAWTADVKPLQQEANGQIAAIAQILFYWPTHGQEARQLAQPR